MIQSRAEFHEAGDHEDRDGGGGLLSQGRFTADRTTRFQENALFPYRRQPSRSLSRCNMTLLGNGLQ